MSREEFLEWKAADYLDPLGMRGLYYMLAQVCMMLKVNNAADGETVKLKDCLPPWMIDEDEPPDWQSARNMAEARYGNHRTT